MTHLVLEDARKLETSYKCRQARKLGIPILSETYVSACVEQHRQITELHPYLLEKTADSQDFDKGKITGSQTIIK